MGRMKHWPTCPECGTSGPHTLHTRTPGGDRILKCMYCKHIWNHDRNMREREVNWAWARR